MGRISEFFDYIKTKKGHRQKEETLYSHLTINEKINIARKEYLKRKRGSK